MNHVEMALGGCASNTAVALSRVGVPTSLWGKLGKDHFSAFALKQLKEAGVEVFGMVADPKVSTSATVVLVDSKARRSFLHSVAANDHIYRRDLSFQNSALSNTYILEVTSYSRNWMGTPMAAILREAQRKGLTTSLDTAWDMKNRWMKALKPCLPYLDYFMPSDREVKMLLGYTDHVRAAKAFLALGAKCVVVKMGEKGSFLMNRKGERHHVPAFRSKVVDTTGAGIVFVRDSLKDWLQMGFETVPSIGKRGGCLRDVGFRGYCGFEIFSASYDLLKRAK